MFMKKENIQFIIDDSIDQVIAEHRDELASDYVKHIEKSFPELHGDLVKLAKFAILSVRGGYSPTKKLEQLSGLLKMDPDLDPRYSGDTHGVRLYIDHLIDDNKLAGQAKRWYQSTIDQLLKKNYTIPRKKRERKFKKYLKDRQKENIQKIVDQVISENIDFLIETTNYPIRQSFNMAIPDDIMELAKILNNSGHELYVVGGAVRDAILGKTPKDYDIATDAKPDRILTILSQHPEYRTLEIGKSFGIINVITPDGNEYELATFREDIGKGRRPDAVEFTTIENDVKRRDLTINALFYDISKHEIVDYVGGINDLKKGLVRAVGNPVERFDEDRLRILRVIRFAARMGAGLDKATENAIKSNNSLDGVSAERIRDEFIKSIASAKSVIALHALYDSFNLWDQIFPKLKINSWYRDTKNVPVQLALLLRDNDPKTLSKKLNDIKYGTVETRQIVFLNLFQTLSPGNAFALKKLYKSTNLSPEDLLEFASLNGTPIEKMVKAFIKFEPSVNGQEVMDQGFKGAEIGKEIERRETENFTSLLK